MRQIARRYGDVFTLTIPVFGRTVIVADPALAKQVFMANTDDVGNIQPNLCAGPRARVRCSPSTAPITVAPQAADAAVARQEHQELRAHLRGGDAARGRELA